METQIKAFYKTAHGIEIVTIFGYSTKGVPSLEINGVGKLSKNIKEKLIYLTRLRRLQVPLRRFVVCVDLNELNDKNTQCLKWLEFPLLLMYWHLCGLLPIKKLDNCLSSGWIKTNGDIFQMKIEPSFFTTCKSKFNPIEYKTLKLIDFNSNPTGEINVIDSAILLESIPQVCFKVG